MRANKVVLVILSVFGGLFVLAAITLLPAFEGAALAVAIAMLWCWWLEHHPSVDESTLGVWSYRLDVSNTPTGPRRDVGTRKTTTHVDLRDVLHKSG